MIIAKAEKTSIIKMITKMQRHSHKKDCKNFRLEQLRKGDRRNFVLVP